MLFVKSGVYDDNGQRLVKSLFFGSAVPAKAGIKFRDPDSRLRGNDCLRGND